MSPPRKEIKNPVLRSVLATDAEALRGLYAYSLRHNPAGFIQNPAFRGDIFERTQKYREENGEILGLFLPDGTLIGFGGLQKKKDGLCELCNLHLHPDFQGQGLGRHMCEHLINLARTLGYHIVELHVTATQKRALDLYRRLGFVETKRQEYAVELQKFETVFMELRL